METNNFIIFIFSLPQFDFDARSYSAESIFSDEDGEDPHNVTTISQGYIRSGIIKCGVGDYITTKFAIANLDTLCKLICETGRVKYEF